MLVSRNRDPSHNSPAGHPASTAVGSLQGGRTMNASLIAVLTVALSAPLAAQWLNYTTPGIPRTPDGKPNLSAPAPRTPDGKPDFSGIWATRRDSRFFQDLSAGGVEIPMLPWAKQLYEERKKNQQRGHPSERCLG